MKMRGAVAGAEALRVTAKGDGLPLLVPAIGVAAIAVFQLHERQMAWVDFNAAKLHGLDTFDRRHRPLRKRPPGLRSAASAPAAKPRLDRLRRRGRLVRPTGPAKPDPFCLADRGAA